MPPDGQLHGDASCYSVMPRIGYGIHVLPGVSEDLECGATLRRDG